MDIKAVEHLLGRRWFIPTAAATATEKAEEAEYSETSMHWTVYTDKAAAAADGEKEHIWWSGGGEV